MKLLEDGFHTLGFENVFGFMNDPNFHNWELDVIVKDGMVTHEREMFKPSYIPVEPYKAEFFN